MAMEHDANLNNSENAFSSPVDTVKDTFDEWLSNKQRDADSIIVSLEPVSQQTFADSITIWNDKIEQAFRNYLKSNDYVERTLGNYSRAITLTIRNYSDLAQKATGTSTTVLDAIHKYIALLNEDKGFVEANAKRHYLFSAALAALERFYSIGKETLDYENINAMSPPPPDGSTNLPNSLLDDIVDLEAGKKGLQAILETHFQGLHGYSNIRIIWSAAQYNLSLFLNDNAINSAEDLWRFMTRVFLGKLTMRNPHIWEKMPDYPLNSAGLIINLARQLDYTVFRKQIDDYFTRIKIEPPNNGVIIQSGYLLYYDDKRFILTEVVQLSDERVLTITNALDKLFECESVAYIVLRDISDDWFSSLPKIIGNLKWTPLLLQEVLRLKSAIGYRTIFSGLGGQALDTLGVAIVSRKSEINTFADVAHRYCYEHGQLGKKMPTEDFRIKLCNAGMLKGNELIWKLHKALTDRRFAFTDHNNTVQILEK
jgi:hypothetical protein